MASSRNASSSNSKSHTSRPCLCSPTTHPGSFRCSLHRIVHKVPSQSTGHTASNHWGFAMIAKTDSLKAFLLQIIKPSSHDLKRRRNFQPKPTRVDVAITPKYSLNVLIVDFLWLVSRQMICRTISLSVDLDVLARAYAAAITLDTPGANYRTVWALSKYFLNVKTFVYAHDVDHGLILEKAEATTVVPETLEPSLQLAAAVLAQTDDLQDHIIICGFGRVGQIIAQLLLERLIPFVALDVRSSFWVIYASLMTISCSAVLRVLHKVGAERACAAAITLDTPGANYRSVWALSKYFPNVKTFVRAHDVDHGLILEKAGATAVVPETLEPSLQLAAAVLAQHLFYVHAGSLIAKQKRLLLLQSVL
ncbi:hypothetical protein TEA_021838 [Camellia sinensis var. sinensis]|uniref:RCK N-terminal domain-containing protein n=1 Tax=Camellia sinensis var. sinensis TaxID=542762 RepID=A0A4V3WLH5_CAMSN|nr:hypothetical protein TEA_021838 [Camellia sinensis var. sinensis]